MRQSRPTSSLYTRVSTELEFEIAMQTLTYDYLISETARALGLRIQPSVPLWVRGRRRGDS